MIYLNGQQIESIARFSTRFQSVLSMIAGGTEWLAWAINDKATPPVNAENEDSLLSMIQLGLHCNDYILFNSFRSSLSKIITMSDADVAQLAYSRKTVYDNTENLRIVLQKNHIKSYSNINEAIGFIANMAFWRYDLFQVPSFSDMLALTGFAERQDVSGDTVKEKKMRAYTFAQKYAATIPDFIHLSEFYEYVTEQQLPGNLTPQVQDVQAEGIYLQLLPAAYYLLFTPNAGISNNEKELREKVPELARENRFIGYDTTSSAVLNLARNINFENWREKDQQPQIDSYLTAVNNLVSFTPASEYYLSQDGKIATLRFEKSNSMALIGINEIGNVFILPQTKLNEN